MKKTVIKKIKCETGNEAEASRVIAFPNRGLGTRENINGKIYNYVFVR